MKKMILSIGIIALFIGLAFIPAGASVKTQVLKSVEQKNNILSEPDYTFPSAKIKLISGHCYFWEQQCYFQLLSILTKIFLPRYWIWTMEDPMHGWMPSIFFDTYGMGPGVISITPPGGTPVIISSEEHPNAVITLYFKGWLSSREFGSYLNGEGGSIEVYLND